MHICIAP